MDEGVFESPQAKRCRAGDPQTPVMQLPASPFLKRLGYGTGVDVYLMKRPQKYNSGGYNSPWALKTVIKKYDRNSFASSRLRTEANILQSLSHPNIIGFRAFGKNQKGAECLAMEHGHKSLSDLIEERGDAEGTPFSAVQIMLVARDVAKALDYLHNEKRLLHGDLKSANVLILGDFQAAKVCDFGVSLKLDENGVVSDPNDTYIGTQCWSAKEVVDEETITHKTDIFSYGLTLWEMISLTPPHCEDIASWSETEEGTSEQTLQQNEEEFEKLLGTRPKLPSSELDVSYNPIIELFYCCTSENPDDRPGAKQIVEHLNALANSKST